MNICIVAYKFGTEQEIGKHLGTYHYFIEKMRRVSARGHRVVVVAPWLKLYKKGSKQVGTISIVRFWPPMLALRWCWPINRFIRFLYIRQTQRHTLRVIRQMQADVVYVWQAREAGYAVACIKDKLMCPFIFRQITAWKWHFERTAGEIFQKASWYQIVMKRDLKKIIDPILAYYLDIKTQKKFADAIYHRADAVVLLSEAAVQEAVELGLERNKARIIGVAIETDQFKPMGVKKELRKELGIQGEEVVCFIGRINFAEKGIGVLIEAMPLVVQRVPGVNLLIIGGGETERASRLISALGMGNNIQMVGKKPLGDLVKYINASDVFVVPSLWMEAFGQVTIEAMSCGVPVVTSDAGASPEINKDRVTGFVVPAGDGEKTAHAIIQVLLDPELRKRLGENARQRVQENYTYEVMVEKFLTVCNV